MRSQVASRLRIKRRRTKKFAEVASGLKVKIATTICAYIIRIEHLGGVQNAFSFNILPNISGCILTRATSIRFRLPTSYKRTKLPENAKMAANESEGVNNNRFSGHFSVIFAFS